MSSHKLVWWEVYAQPPEMIKQLKTTCSVASTFSITCVYRGITIITNGSRSVSHAHPRFLLVDERYTVHDLMPQEIRETAGNCATSWGNISMGGFAASLQFDRGSHVLRIPKLKLPRVSFLWEWKDLKPPGDDHCSFGDYSNPSYLEILWQQLTGTLLFLGGLGSFRILGSGFKNDTHLARTL